MSEGLLQFPPHNTRGFRWPWGKNWCLGHLPASSLAACSLQRKKAMKGHQCKREAEWGWESCAQNRASSMRMGDQWPWLLWYQILTHTGQPLSLPPFQAMLLSDGKHFKDLHFQKYYINNSGIWNVLWNFKMKNWKNPLLPFEELSILCPYTKYIKQRTFGVKPARFLNWLFFYLNICYEYQWSNTSHQYG